MTLSKDALRNNVHSPVIKEKKVVRKGTPSIAPPLIHRRKKKKHSRNIKQIFILSFDALRERKASCANNSDGYKLSIIICILSQIRIIYNVLKQDKIKNKKEV